LHVKGGRWIFDIFWHGLFGASARLASQPLLFAASLEAYIISDYLWRAASKRLSDFRCETFLVLGWMTCMICLQIWSIRQMPFDKSLAGRIRDALARKKGVEEKKLFGDIGFLLNGQSRISGQEDIQR
jgi:hypothetical protein